MGGNANLTFIYRVSDGFANGIWSVALIAPFLLVLTDDLQEVGVAQAIQGLMVVCTAIPAGWLASRIRKDAILRFLALLQSAAIALVCVAVLHDDWTDQLKFGVLCGGLALWGVAQGNSPVVDALFAASVPVASTRRLYGRLHMGYILSQALGPAVASALFFLHTPDDWSLDAMQPVLLAGMAASTLPTFVLLLFSDSHTAPAPEADAFTRPLLPSGGSGSRRRGSSPRAGDAAAAAARSALRRPLLPGPPGVGDPSVDLDLEDGRRLAEASNLSHAGAGGGWRAEEEQNLDGFDGVTFRTPGASTDVSPARPVVPVETAAPAGASGAALDADVASGLPFRPLLAGGSDGSPTTSAAAGAGAGVAAAPAEPPVPEVGSHALDIGDTLSDYSSQRSQASSIPPVRTQRGMGAVDPRFRMAPLDEDHPVTGMPAARHGFAGSPASLSSNEDFKAAAEPSFNMLLARSPACPVHGQQGQQGQQLRQHPSGDTGATGSEPGPVEAPGAVCTCSQASAQLALRPSLSIGKEASFNLAPPPAFASGQSVSLVPAAPAPWSLQPTGGIGSTSAPTAAEAANGDGEDKVGESSRQHGVAVQAAVQVKVAAIHEQLERSWSLGHRSKREGRGAQHSGDGGGGGGGGGAAGEGADGQVSLAAGGLGSRRKARRLSREVPMADAPWGPAAGGCCASCSYDATWVPGVLTVTDFVMGLASGLAIKFIPIFFMSEVDMPPSAVALMYCSVPLAHSGTAYLAQALSKVLGRAPTIVFTRACGILLLFLVAAHPEMWPVRSVIVPIYIVRTSLMNCNFALEKSIFAEYATKESQAFWAPLQTVTSFGWAAGPLLGGWLISAYGFQFTFFLTVALQLVGWLCSLLLLPIVPRNELSAAELVAIILKLRSLHKNDKYTTSH